MIKMHPFKTVFCKKKNKRLLEQLLTLYVNIIIIIRNILFNTIYIQNFNIVHYIDSKAK